jgi:MSHA biogenesis protein MshP
MINSRKLQSGFSAIMAVVLIVLLALMGGYMATMTGISSINTTASAGTMQAWFAARSGVEWAAQQIIVSAPGACFATPPINLTGGNTDGFTVTLTCNATPHTESGIGGYNVYKIRSRATRGTPGSPVYVARQIDISITDAQ